MRLESRLRYDFRLREREESRVEDERELLRLESRVEEPLPPWRGAERLRARAEASL